MVFCNNWNSKIFEKTLQVTILILIDGFLQYKTRSTQKGSIWVTILILIDGFLQYSDIKFIRFNEAGSQSLF